MCPPCISANTAFRPTLLHISVERIIEPRGYKQFATNSCPSGDNRETSWVEAVLKVLAASKGCFPFIFQRGNARGGKISADFAHPTTAGPWGRLNQCEKSVPALIPDRMPTNKLANLHRVECTPRKKVTFEDAGCASCHCS